MSKEIILRDKREGVSRLIFRSVHPSHSACTFTLVDAVLTVIEQTRYVNRRPQEYYLPLVEVMTDDIIPEHRDWLRCLTLAPNDFSFDEPVYMVYGNDPMFKNPVQMFSCGLLPAHECGILALEQWVCAKHSHKFSEDSVYEATREEIHEINDLRGLAETPKEWLDAIYLAQYKNLVRIGYYRSQYVRKHLPIQEPTPELLRMFMTGRGQRDKQIAVQLAWFVNRLCYFYKISNCTTFAEVFSVLAVAVPKVLLPFIHECKTLARRGV